MLEFGHLFNKSIDKVSWPSTLQRLKFGYKFDHRIDCVSWPSELNHLTLGWNFTYPLDGVAEWPPQLTTIHLDFGPGLFRPSLRHVRWPDNLEVLIVSPHVILRNVILPEGTVVQHIS